MASKPDRLIALKAQFTGIEEEVEELQWMLHNLLSDAETTIEGLQNENGRLREALLARLEHEGIINSTGYNTIDAHNAAVEQIRQLTDAAFSKGETP